MRLSWTMRFSRRCAGRVLSGPPCWVLAIPLQLPLSVFPHTWILKLLAVRIPVFHSHPPPGPWPASTEVFGGTASAASAVPLQHLACPLTGTTYRDGGQGAGDGGDQQRPPLRYQDLRPGEEQRLSRKRAYDCTPSACSPA
jgi:hypothetical protein